MLDEVKRAGGDFIVSWVPGGKAFKVHEVDQFVKKIIPLYFKQRQYKSFQRQLHLYGFQRIAEGRDKGTCYCCFVVVVVVEVGTILYRSQQEIART